jgi:hypothetical protein
MRSFRDITEAKETAVFGFGRFNPSTIGHEAVIEKIASVAKGNPFFIYPSHTTGPKDPLKHSLKIAWMRKMFPKYKKNIIVDNKAKTVIDIAEKLYKDGYKNLILVAGSDRVKEFDALLQRYNDAPDKKGNQLFKFDSVKVVSAGERDPDADGVAGMSASKLRKAASDGKFDDFKKGIPNTLNDADKKKYYFDVRKGMGIREDREMGDDYDSLRDAYLTGKIWNVGEVVEANGISGEVVRKGTNYLSFVTEDGKVHKAWLHEVKSPLQKLKDFDKSRVAAGKPPIFTDRKPPKFIRMKKAGMMTIMNVPTDEIDKFEKKGYKIIEDLVGVNPMSGPTGQIFALKSEEVELDERNYAKEYANYGGRPEQIARRSSRNKARRAMGDKVVKGMDVGHADNNPMNNDPKNLRMEKPSDNRREPRLREKRDAGYPDDSVKIGKKHWIIYKDRRDWYGYEVDKEGNQIGDVIFDPRKSDLKTMLAKESLDEMAWYKVALAKISQLNHPKDYEKMVKRYMSDMKNPELKNKTASYIAAKIANDYKGQDGRKLVQYINKLVDDGKLPKELKAEYQEEETMQTFSDLIKQINEVKQDKDVDDKDGTQPAKYYAGDMAKSTKSKRDAHFKAKKSGPAPGDADAKTKPSTHTKKFKQMFGEVLPDNADQGDYIDDFEKSDAPQFKGKSKEKRKDMAIAAYLSKNESFLDNVNRMLSESGHTDVASMKNKIQIAQKALMTMQGELTKLGDEDDLPTWWTNKVATAVSRLDDMSDYIDTQVEDVQLDEKIAGLVKKADKSGMPYSVLKKVYDRGMAAWKTGHRPGTTPQQWAFARVNSFTTKSSGTWGKADKDLAKQVEQLEELEEKGPGLWANIHKKRKEGRPMRKKGEKGAPTPAQLKRAKGEELEEQDLNEWGEVEEESEYQGRKVTLNKPSAGDVKKSKVYVKNEKGNVVKVNFGDPNMTIKKSNPARRKSFRARHNCENPGPKWMARYWSCKAW